MKQAQLRGISVAVLLWAAGMSLPAFAQITWTVGLNLQETGGSSDSLYFGVHPSGTDSIDAALGETELPPKPPGPVLDVRFSGTTLGNGLKRDIRSGTTTMKTYTVDIQRAVGGTVTIAWGILPAGNYVLQDPFGGIVLNVDMTTTSQATVMSSLTQILIKATPSIPTSPVSPPTNLRAIDTPADSGGKVTLKFIASPHHPGASGTTDATDPMTAYYVYRGATRVSAGAVACNTLAVGALTVGTADTVTVSISTDGSNAAMYYWLRAVAGTRVSGLCGPNLAVPIDNSVSVRVDLNGNRQVDVLDIAIIAQIFATASEYDPAIDLNNDGEISVLDIAEIASRFGQSY